MGPQGVDPSDNLVVLRAVVIEMSVVCPNDLQLWILPAELFSGLSSDAWLPAQEV